MGPRSSKAANTSTEGGSDIAKRRMERRAAVGRRSDARWQEILAASTVVFRNLGYAQATLEDVANETGINRATLYYYVGTKAELLTSILQRPLEELTAELQVVQSLDLEPKEKVRLVIGKHVQALEETPEHFIFLAERLEHIVEGREADVIAERAEAYGRTLRSIIDEGISSGQFRAELDPRLAMLAIAGMLNWIHRWYDPKGPNTLREIGEQFAMLALGGLVAPPDAPVPRNCAARAAKR